MNAEAGLELRGVGAQGCEAAGRTQPKGIVGHIGRVVGSTPFRPCGLRNSLDKIRKTDRVVPRKAGESSVAVTRKVWANESIRQKIIGHTMAVGGHLFGSGVIRSGLDIRSAQVAFAHLEEHARDHGVGVLVEQLVDKGIDLLAQVSRVTETRELVAVKSVAGSGEKEFPRRLGAANGHRALQWTRVARDARNRITQSIILTSKYQVTGLWKTVQSEEKSARTCSGCAGDYEDPDRSAWEKDFEGEEMEVQREAGDEPGPDE